MNKELKAFPCQPGGAGASSPPPPLHHKIEGMVDEVGVSSFLRYLRPSYCILIVFSPAIVRLRALVLPPPSDKSDSRSSSTLSLQSQNIMVH